MKTSLNILLLILIIFFITKVFEKDKYQPTYYPNSYNLSIYSNGPEVDTIDECRDWVNQKALIDNKKDGEWDYECGLNCNYDNRLSLFVCEETTR